MQKSAMGKDGDYSNVAKVYESKKEKKRRRMMSNNSTAEEVVITPRVEFVKAGSGEESGKPNSELDNGDGRQKRAAGDVLKRKLGSEGNRGKVVGSGLDSKIKVICVDQSDGEDVNADSVDSIEYQSDMTLGIGNSLVPLKLSYRNAGNAEENDLESMSEGKRSMGIDGDDMLSRKKTKTEGMDSGDEKPEKFGEGDKIMGSRLPWGKHNDGEDSSKRNLRHCRRTNSKAEAVRWLGRSGQREPHKTKDAGSDIGLKKNIGNGGSLIKMYGKNDALNALKSSKMVSGSENLNAQLKGNRNKRKSNKKSASNVKLHNKAGITCSEDTSKLLVTKVYHENVSHKGDSKNVDLLHGNKYELAAKGDNFNESTESRSAAKNRLREQIKSILFDAGWRVEFRPRRGRHYEDAVYVSPQGSGYWSITKAYNVYLNQFRRACDGTVCSGKQQKASARLDGDLKEANSTAVVIPPDILHLLKRTVVNKRRSKKELEDAKHKVGGGRRKKRSNQITKDKRTRDVVGGARAKDSMRRDRALFARSLNRDEGLEKNDYAPYIWKRTILSWMIDLGVVPANGKVRYMNKRMTRVLLDGRITRDGIHCSCCNNIFTVSKFEIHSGSKLHQPYENIYLEASGLSLLQCQINAWETQESKQHHFLDVDDDGNDPNDDTCGICGDGGDLICCDSCPSTFHLSCLGIEMLPSGDWHCTNCSCKFCGAAHDSVSQTGNAHSALLNCSQCMLKFHKDCVPEGDAVSTVHRSSCNVFCGRSCRKVFKKLQKLIGIRNKLEAGFSWSIVRRFDDPSNSFVRMSQTVESNSKIAVAYSVMDECFVPIIDQRSGINLIHNVMYNCWSNFNRLNFSGFYTFILEQGDEIVGAASVRIHDTKLAEMPFIGTRCMYRRQGMCRRLFQGIESVLRSLCIRKLIIPAISELVDTWTNVFGFEPLDVSQNKEVKSASILVFPGTGLLQKSLVKDSAKKTANLGLENNPETQIFATAEKNYSPDEPMDSKESKCDAETVKPYMPVLEYGDCKLLLYKSGCHTQFCSSSDNPDDVESNDLLSVVSSDSQHPASEFLDGISGIEASVISETVITDAVENCNSEEGVGPPCSWQKKLEDKPALNGVEHATSKKCKLTEADDDKSHEINYSKVRYEANELNSIVNEETFKVSMHVHRISGNEASEFRRPSDHSNSELPATAVVENNYSVMEGEGMLKDKTTHSGAARDASKKKSELVEADEDRSLEVSGMILLYDANKLNSNINGVEMSLDAPGKSGNEPSEFKLQQDQSNFELPVTVLYFENNGECPLSSLQKKIKDKQDLNGVAHLNNSKNCEFIESNEDIWHETNDVKSNNGANELNSMVNEVNVDVLIDATRYLNTSPEKCSCSSSTVCESGSEAIP